MDGRGWIRKRLGCYVKCKYKKNAIICICHKPISHSQKNIKNLSDVETDILQFHGKYFLILTFKCSDTSQKSWNGGNDGVKKQTNKMKNRKRRLI